MAGSKPLLQYVSFALGKEIFALDVMKIKGVERITDITAIPKYPTFIEGVINLRGEIIPIVDLRKRFGMQGTDYTKETRVILLELEMIVIGLIVDRVFEVFELAEGEIGHIPSFSKITVGRQFVQGVAEVRDKLIVLLNMDTLFSEEETGSLSGGV